MSERVSAVIPVHNGIRFISEALHSVAMQTRPVAEVIVVDDASTDGTAELVRTAHPNVILLQLPANSGPSVARNRGIAAATGDFIAFLDSDDSWLPEKTRRQLDWYRENPSSRFVTGLQETFIEEGHQPPDWAYRMAAAPVAGGVPSAWLVRRTAFDLVGPFDESFRHGEDIDWLTRAAYAGISFDTLDEVVFRKRVHDTNLTLQREPSEAGLFRALRASAARRRAGSA